MSNVEQRIPNDEVNFFPFFPSAFVIRYSTCPLCPQTDSIRILPAFARHGALFTANFSAGQAGILRFGFDLLYGFWRGHRLRPSPGLHAFIAVFLGLFFLPL